MLLFISYENVLWFSRAVLGTLIVVAATLMLLRFKSVNSIQRTVALMNVTLAVTYFTILLYYCFFVSRSSAITALTPFETYFSGFVLISFAHGYMLQFFSPQKLSFKIFIFCYLLFIFYTACFAFMRFCGVPYILAFDIGSVILSLRQSPLYVLWFFIFIWLICYAIYVTVYLYRCLLMHYHDTPNESLVRIYSSRYTIVLCCFFEVLVLLGVSFLAFSFSDLFQIFFFILAAFVFCLISLFLILPLPKVGIFSDCAVNNTIDCLTDEVILSTNTNDDSPVKPSDMVLISRIDHLMQHQQLFTQSDLSADFFASCVMVSRKKLYLLLKQHYNTSFSNFINLYRLEYAARLLADPLYRSVSVIEIAEKAGFNSINTFHHCFKEKYGITPAKYRK